MGWSFAAAFFFRPWDSRLGLGLHALLHVYFFFPSNYLPNSFPMSSMHEFFKMPLSNRKGDEYPLPLYRQGGCSCKVLKLLTSRSIRRVVLGLL